MDESLTCTHAKADQQTNEKNSDERSGTRGKGEKRKWRRHVKQQRIQWQTDAPSSVGWGKADRGVRQNKNMHRSRAFLLYRRSGLTADRSQRITRAHRQAQAVVSQCRRLVKSTSFCLRVFLSLQSLWGGWTVKERLSILSTGIRRHLPRADA